VTTLIRGPGLKRVNMHMKVKEW